MSAAASPKNKDADRWALDHTELMWGPELGRGAYGIVYDGKWRTSRVAIKVMTQMTEEALESFEKEAALMRHLRPHKNVVQLMGITSEPLALVTEFADNGSLDVWLSKNAPDTPAKVELVKGIASGMYHLHAEKIIHRDLAARNVLLSSDLTPKVSDFGQSRIDSGNENTTKSDTGPLKWMAPESILEKSYSVKSDVWSFGITVIEIFTRALPYPSINGLAVATGVAAGTLSPPIPDDVPEPLRSVMSQCFEHRAANRPDFAAITRALA
jgi:serine/threonine protein kinase